MCIAVSALESISLGPKAVYMFFWPGNLPGECYSSSLWPIFFLQSANSRLVWCLACMNGRERGLSCNCGEEAEEEDREERGGFRALSYLTRLFPSPFCAM